ncbi:MAG: hypothetical protein H7343_13330 [Undibacterium sp.]|nr:hypothetical protein [Opitutaceae bacterium]
MVPLSVSVLTTVSADPLSKKYDLDFYRDVPSRNLKGLATRSDGRLVAGPVLTELTAVAPFNADLLWTLESAGAPDRWLLGTGPDGRVLEATLDVAKSAFTTREIAKLDEPHIFALKRLPDGALLVGTSPHGVLFLLRDGKVTARVSLPVDSIFDLLVLDADTALIATGNPARLYRIDLKQFATSGVAPEKLITPAQFTARGLTLVGEIRDRNLRRLARFPDGRVAAGSSPKGNIYVFPATISSSAPARADPVLLQENRDAEVTDLLPQPNGDLYATLVYSPSAGDARINVLPSKPSKEGTDALAAPAPVSFSPPAEKFSGRSTLVFFPAGGFPEILSSRSNLAFYQLARRGDTLLIAGGEQGELIGYDLTARLPLTYAGSASSQLNALAAVPGTPDRFLVLRNNAPGLALLDFKATAERSAETRRIDLGTAALFGALRFDRLRDLAPAQLALEIKTSVGSDEVEGWTAWTPLLAADATDPAWRAPALRGRYAKLRLKLPAAAASLEIEKPAVYFLPQNRRPTLQEFRFLAPNFALIPGSEPAPSVTTSLSSILSASKDDDGGQAKRSKAGFLASQIVPAPGAQVALWTLVDPDGDSVTASFSIRREGDTGWTDLSVSSREPYVLFDTARLADGIYFTRLVATEAAPRPAPERLSITFETDNLIVDHTPPAILEATVVRTADTVKITVHGRDAMSLLEGIEVTFNNGAHDTVEQPADGIRDGREESFILEIPLARVTGATAAEVTLYDIAGNAVTRRITL